MEKLIDNKFGNLTPVAMVSNQPNGLRFEVAWNKVSFTWDVTSSKGFYLATRDESLAEGVRALLEGRTEAAESFAKVFLASRGLL